MRFTASICLVYIFHIIVLSQKSPFAYITNYESNNISVIDTTINKVTATVDVGSHPAGIVVNPDGTKAYVVNSYDDTVSIIDTTTKKVTATMLVGTYPIEVAFGHFIDNRTD